MLNALGSFPCYVLILSWPMGCSQSGSIPDLNKAICKVSRSTTTPCIKRSVASRCPPPSIYPLVTKELFPGGGCRCRPIQCAFLQTTYVHAYQAPLRDNFRERNCLRGLSKHGALHIIVQGLMSTPPPVSNHHVSERDQLPV